MTLGMTGTMITNSLTELHAQMSLFAPDLLKRMDMDTFDHWADMFADVHESIEVRQTGKVEERARMSRWKNLDLLSSLVNEFASAITGSQMVAEINLMTKEQRREAQLPKVRRVDVITRSSREQNYLMRMWLMRRAKHMSKDRREDNALVVSSDARKVALDMKLLSPLRLFLPTGEDIKDRKEAAKVHRITRIVGELIGKFMNKSMPNRKATYVARNAAKIYKRGAAYKGTQIIFCDLGVPKGTKDLEAAEAKQEGGIDARRAILWRASSRSVSTMILSSCW